MLQRTLVGEYGRSNLQRKTANQLVKAACGYGMTKENLLEIFGKLTDSEIDELLYLCYRCAEKSGFDTLYE